MNKIIVTNLNKKNIFSEKKIKGVTQEFLRLLKKKNCCLDVFLVTSSKMKFLNKKFRNKNKTTSILTFVEPVNFPHPESKLKFLGEIYLNADSRGLNTDKRGRGLRKSALSQRLSALLAHGLLHLFGFQHTKKDDRIKMEAKEKFLISNF